MLEGQKTARFGKSNGAFRKQLDEADRRLLRTRAGDVNDRNGCAKQPFDLPLRVERYHLPKRGSPLRAGPARAVMSRASMATS